MIENEQKYLYKFSGTVVRHTGRGKKIGFPTANIEAPKDIPDAIYVGVVSVEGEDHPAAIFVGVAETYGGKSRFAEAYLLDFSGDLYGKKLTFKLLKKLRDNRKFSGEKELIEQMKKDDQKARKYFIIK